MSGACALRLLQRHWHAGRRASSGGHTNLQLCGLVLRVTCCGQGLVDLGRLQHCWKQAMPHKTRVQGFLERGREL